MAPFFRKLNEHAPQNDDFQKLNRLDGSPSHQGHHYTTQHHTPQGTPHQIPPQQRDPQSIRFGDSARASFGEARPIPQLDDYTNAQIHAMAFLKDKEKTRVRHDEDTWTTRQSPLNYVIFASFLVVSSLLGWFSYQWLSSKNDQPPPVISADETPYKVRPENPGGIIIPHQDKLIYGRIMPEQQQTVEHLLPQPEHPIALQTPESHYPYQAAPYQQHQEQEQYAQGVAAPLQQDMQPLQQYQVHQEEQQSYNQDPVYSQHPDNASYSPQRPSQEQQLPHQPKPIYQGQPLSPLPSQNQIIQQPVTHPLPYDLPQPQGMHKQPTQQQQQPHYVPQFPPQEQAEDGYVQPMMPQNQTLPVQQPQVQPQQTYQHQGTTHQQPQRNSVVRQAQPLQHQQPRIQQPALPLEDPIDKEEEIAKAALDNLISDELSGKIPQSTQKITPAKPSQPQSNPTRGAYRLQVASFGGESEAKNEVNRLRNLDASLFKDRKFIIQKSTNGGVTSPKKTVYKVMIGFFPTANEASQFKSKLKPYRINGIVVKNKSETIRTN